MDVAFSEEVRDRIGDTRVRTSSEAAEWQATIETAIQKKLSFKISSGDLIYARFDKLPEYRPRKTSKVNQSIGHNLVGHQTKFLLCYLSHRKFINPSVWSKYQVVHKRHS